MDTQATVLQVFAELTRYPTDILDPQADLEADLGIDSVKRTEILAALQERFELPVDLQAPAEEVTTIAAISAFIDQASGRSAGATAQSVQSVQQSPAQPAPSYSPPSYSPPAAGASTADLRRDVLSTLRDVIDETLTRMDAGQPLAPPAPQRGGPINGGPVNGNHVNGGLPVDGLAWAERVAAPQVTRPPAQSRQAPRRQAPPVQAAGSDWLPAGYRPFEGRVALVTGSGHGLGRVIATRLSRLGASVVINSFHSRDRGERTAAELRDAGGDAFHAWGSVAKREHLEGMFRAIEERHGRLDFFVSNASNGMIAPLEYITEDHWQKAFTTNVIALHQASLMAAPLMDRAGGGKILAISSPGAQRYIEHFGCQGPVKAALESLVRYLAVELGPRNIQVNALSAGPLYGELLNKYPEGDRLIPYWESRTATGRLGSEEQVTEAVAFLLSRASDPISGAVLLADSTGSQRV